jgi:hypothetical protein
MKKKLMFLSVQSETAYKEQYLQHIQDLYNLRLDSAVTGQQLKDALILKFKDNSNSDAFILAVNEWVEFNIEDNKEWLSLTVIPSPDDGEENHFMVMDMINAN